MVLSIVLAWLPLSWLVFSLCCLWCWLGFHGLARGFGFFVPVLVYVVGLSVFLVSAMVSWICHVGHGFVYDVSWVLSLLAMVLALCSMFFLLFPLRFLLLVFVLFSIGLFLSLLLALGVVFSFCIWHWLLSHGFVYDVGLSLFVLLKGSPLECGPIVFESTAL